MRIAQRQGIFACLIVALFITACGGDGTRTEPTPEPLTLLRQAAADIRTMNTLRFKLQLTGAPVYVDDANVISFVSADGAYQAPDRVSATVRAAVYSVPGQIELVALGDQQFMKHPLLTADRWIERLFSPGFNASKLINSETEGIEAALNAVTDVQMIGREDLFGTQVYHVRGNAPAAAMAAVTVGLIKGTDVIADVYINADTKRVEQIVLLQPGTATERYEDSKWTLELYDYNATDINVIRPDVSDLPTPTPQEGLPTPILIITPGPTPISATPASEPTSGD
jgi:hypothetical protein